MIVDIIKIGNSQGIRIPKNILEEFGAVEKIELELKDHNIILKPLAPRANWDKAFKEMNKNGDDKLLISDTLDIEEDDWQW